MRTATHPQLQLGEIDIANIKIDPRSRDDIPQLLRGLQYLYSDNILREEIFQILEKLPPQKSQHRVGAARHDVVENIGYGQLTIEFELRL